MNPKVSVIVPVYGAEAFLPTCISSLRAQTLRDIELIFVCDGSPDRSLAILRRVEPLDSRIRVIAFEENQGVSAARNAGLDAARGDYIGFCDGDDWAEPQMYETLLRAAEEAGAESSGIAAGEIDTLVDPIPYVASVESIEASTGGLDIEDDDGLTERVWLAPSKYSCAGPRDAYAYYVKEWRTDVDDVQIVSPEPCVVHVYVVLDGGVLPTETEREELAAYLNGDTIRPLTDIVSCQAAEEVPYDISLTYWIASRDQKSAGTIQAQVEAAVDAYESWQRKMGRDINPTELVYRVRAAGAKRVKLTAPADIVIEKTQLPKRNTRTVTYGGLEDD